MVKMYHECIFIYLRNNRENESGMRLFFLINFIFKQLGVCLELENQIQNVDNQENNCSAMTKVNNTSINFSSMSSSCTKSSRNQ